MPIHCVHICRYAHSPVVCAYIRTYVSGEAKIVEICT